MISVIIPVYNVQSYLNECISSVVKQSYSQLEIVLVDDGSTDNSGKICDDWSSLDDRIRVLHKKNGGLSSARNAGLELVTGDFITFVDSDDYIDKYMYENLVSLLIEDEDVDIACCGIELFKDEDCLSVKSFFQFHNEKFDMFEYWKLVLKHKIDNAVWNKLYRKRILVSMRFDEGIINEDILFNLKLINNVKFLKYIPNAYYKYRLRKGSITRQANPKLFDFINNAFFLKKVLLNKYGFSISKEIEGYIYCEMTNCISTVEKYNSKKFHMGKISDCKNYIFEHPINSLCNKYWPLKTKIKLFLVSFTPSIYRFLVNKIFN